IFHRGIGIDRQTVGRCQLGDHSRRSFAVDPPPPARFLTEDDVLGYGQGREELERLMHHAQPEPDRSQRRVDPHLLAPYSDIALVGTMEAVEDRHQGGLAGPRSEETRLNSSHVKISYAVFCWKP